MAIRKIREVGDPLLRKKSRPFDTVDEKAKELLEDLYETLKVTDDGVGLAAPQVGVLRRAIVVDLTMEEENPQGPYFLINPVITKKSGEQVCREGCLSVPGKLGDVIRPEKVTVEALLTTSRVSGICRSSILKTTSPTLPVTELAIMS